MQPVRMQSILITGGAGFVGSNLALHLKARFPSARVVCMDNLYRKGSELNLPRLEQAGCEFFRGDIREAGAFPEGPFEFLLECSAEPSVLAGYGESPDYLMETNLMGTYRCLERAREWGAKVIFFSTSRVYPIAPLEAHPWREEETRFAWEDQDLISDFGFRISDFEKGSTVHGPGCEESTINNQQSAIGRRGVREALLRTASGARSLYGFTKFASEHLIEEYRQAFGLQALINRCSVIAGPWQMGKVDQGVVALWVLRHYFGQPLQYIGYGGGGKQVRDVLHIDDLARLVARQVGEFSDWEGWCGNVGGGLEVSASLRELTEACREVTGREVEVGSDPETRRADLRIFIADCRKIESEHGWKPEKSVRDIVVDIHQWIRQNESTVRASGII